MHADGQKPVWPVPRTELAGPIIGRYKPVMADNEPVITAGDQEIAALVDQLVIVAEMVREAATTSPSFRKCPRLGGRIGR